MTAIEAFEAHFKRDAADPTCAQDLAMWCEAWGVAVAALTVERDALRDLAGERKATIAFQNTRIRTLTAERDAALARVAEVEADSRRLDWLEANGTAQFSRRYDDQPEKRWFDTDTEGSDYSPTLRAAIDAAAATKGSEAP